MEIGAQVLLEDVVDAGPDQPEEDGPAGDPLRLVAVHAAVEEIGEGGELVGDGEGDDVHDAVPVHGQPADVEGDGVDADPDDGEHGRQG